MKSLMLATAFAALLTLPALAEDTAKSGPSNPNNASKACKNAMAIVKVAQPKYDANGNPHPAFVVVRGPGCPEGVKIIFPKKK